MIVNVRAQREDGMGDEGNRVEGMQIFERLLVGLLATYARAD